MEENIKDNPDSKNKKYRDDELSFYEDECITVDMNGLKIRKYYYPLSKVKEIPIHNITYIDIIELNRLSGKYTFIGLCWKLYYYHLDRKRPIKNKAIILNEKDNLITIGITPDDPIKCYQVLRYLMIHMKNNTECQSLLDERDENIRPISGKKQKID